ncbi:tetratricopeptide repeat protein [Baaleninema sp.]|uniref:tetratricopeptide repeat protein n=1 Tax=Baaleninema sp. TaxID=3101197 RepID=UPI003D03AA66
MLHLTSYLKQGIERWKQLPRMLRSLVDRAEVRLHPQDPWKHYHLAKTLLQLQEFQAAEFHYRRVIALDRSIALAHHELADVLQAQGRLSEAEECYRQAIELNEEFFWSYHNLGDVLRKQEKWSEAAETYKKASRFNPDFYPTYEHWSQVAVRSRRWEDAIFAYHRALELQPDNFQICYDLAGLLRRFDRTTEVANLYLKTINLDPTFPWFYHHYFWRTLNTEGKLEEAIERYKTALKSHPDSMEVYVNLGEALTHQKQIPEAITYYRTALHRKLKRERPEIFSNEEVSESLETARKPDFIILGAQKAGTSSLYFYLSKNPQILSPLRKELEFWSWKFHRGIDWYFSQFPPLTPDSQFLTGEACPGYLDFDVAAERLKENSPNTKFIILLRNPVDRAVSHYYHWIRRHQEDRSFDVAIQAKIMEIHQKGTVWNQHSNYVARGVYVEFIRHWLSLFPREKFLILKSEDFYQDPSKTLKKVDNFLGVPVSTLSEYKKHNAGSYSPVSQKSRDYLNDFYSPYNQELEKLLGIELNWN